MSWLRPSGGLVYHWRALTQGWRWRTFRRDVAQWLDIWECPTEELILIGPSGGHTLPTQWLKRFKTIHAYDLDPLARFFFKIRHRHPNITFHRQDMFWHEQKLSIEPLNELLKARPQASVLFCNVLGQVLLEREAREEDWYEFLRQLRALLNTRNWASYHDLFSLENGQVEIDHLTDGEWIKGMIQLSFEWPLSRTRRHSVGAVSAVLPAPDVDAGIRDEPLGATRAGFTF